MATAVWTVPARLTSAIATLLSKQINQDKDSYDRHQVLIEQLTADNGSESSSAEVEVDLESAEDIFDILCGLCLELDTENAAHEDKLASLERESFMLQKKLAVLQSQLQRRGADYKGPDGRHRISSPVHYTTEEQISPAGKAKTVLSATPVLPYEEPSPSRLGGTIRSSQGLSQMNAHDPSSQQSHISSPSPREATPPHLSSSSQTLRSDPISPPQAGNVLAPESNFARASHLSAERPPSLEQSPRNVKKRRRSPSSTSSRSIPSASSLRARSSSRISDSEMSISTQGSRNSSSNSRRRRRRSRSRVSRGRSPGPQTHSPRSRSIPRRPKLDKDIERRQRQSNNHRRGGRRSRRRVLSRSPQAKRMKTCRDHQVGRNAGASYIGPSRRRSRSRSRSPCSFSRERRHSYSRSPTPHYRRPVDRRRSPRRSRSPYTSSRYRDDRDSYSSRRLSRAQPPTPRCHNDYDRYRSRSPRHLNPSPLPSRLAPETQRLPRNRDGESTPARNWERILYLPPRPDGTAGKHAIWVRKDKLDAPGADQRGHQLSAAPPSVPSVPSVPSSGGRLPPPSQVIPRTAGPGPRDGFTTLGPHWNFHSRPRNRDNYHGPGQNVLNPPRSVGIMAAVQSPQAPPTRPLLERVSSLPKGPEGPSNQPPPSLASRMSPVRPMRNIQVSHGLLKRSPLNFATGRLRGEGSGPSKLTGSNQVPVANLGSRMMGASATARGGYPGAGGVSG